MILIGIVIAVVIAIVLIFLLIFLSKDRQSYGEYTDLGNETKDISFEKNEDAFDSIYQSIKNSFMPMNFRDDEECERQLIAFLSKKFPNKAIARGHTSKGEKLDIVIDGTYALELIIANNEGKLAYLTNLMINSQKDFEKRIAIIVDVGKVSPDSLKEFGDDLKRLGIRTIIKKSNVSL